MKKIQITSFIALAEETIRNGKFEGWERDIAMRRG